MVENTNEDAEKRIQLLEERKLEIEHQIQRIKTGEDVKVFEEFEIVPRFNQINQSAKELLSDFKEVEDNFKEITKGIYQKHSDGSLTKNDILEFYSNLVKKNQRKLSVQIWGNNANTGNSLRNNETLSSSRNNAGKTQKIINDFSNLEKYTMNDNKLTFYQV